MVVVSAPDHPLARLKRVQWAQLAKCDWILPPLGSAARADIDELFVKTIYAEKGPILKRFTARAKGRGNKIEKQTCHITVTLGN